MNGHSGNRHMMIMVLCCLIPLAAVFLVSVMGISLNSIGTAALVLLCPLLHIFMMRGMMGHGSSKQASCHESQQETPRALPSKQG